MNGDGEGPLPLGRRAALGLLGATLAGCGDRPEGPAAARAQPAQRRPPPQAAGGMPAVVMPVPVPCPGQPGDLVGLVLEGLEGGSPAATVVVFGQAFRVGDLPRGAGLTARLAADGRPLPAQLDVQTRHPDGSVRFGVVSLAAPALRPGARAGVMLAVGEAAGGPLALGTAFAGRSAVLEVAPAEGGEPWRADLLALAQAVGGRPWQSGPLVTQVRVAAPVPAAAAGSASLRLVADIAARADGSLWVDCWLRNDIAMRPNGGAATYRMRLMLDGREALRVAEPLRHWQYSGWGRLLGSRAGGDAAATPPLVRHDPAYLAETAAVARYDLSTGVDEASLQRMAQAQAQPAWAQPLGNRGIEQKMGAPGARPDLGQTTMWQAAWLISGDPRAAAHAVDQAEAAGAVPWHFWDPAGGAEGRGGWMDERRWPELWVDGRGGRPPRGLLQPFGSGTSNRGGNWGTIPSHQPNLSYLPFLLTGRRAFLDNLTAQGCWNVLENWPANRGYDEQGPIRGINIVKNRQLRTAAWSMRQVGEAAWIAPDDDPHRAYLREVEAANWGWIRAKLPDWTALQGDVHGYILWTGFGYNPSISPWQQDYFASTAAASARRGGEDARAILSWMTNFIVGRFHAEAKGLPRHDSVNYTLALFPTPLPQFPEPPAKPFKTWAEIGKATQDRGTSNGDGWAQSNGEYARLGLLSLALMIEIFDLEEAKQAYTWLAGSGAPYIQQQVFARMPQHNIVPRGMPRIPARQPRCIAAAAPRAT
ncbi:hypothetical protein [Paracraurococcus ruber]|uniref:Uncharacterized protein n=1 Tax=Paracraurococcus ruber TaxID=77675 RepID=A0ABS1CUU5_9PROT|nr:hypothetical protein [Paracraurococcus ruber]MBK1658286.1 hypothetical protein [Paracraurococcus ruber]TDG31009.1 hypothetical protein E2C05_12330 [Paracraurococcus ruber]